MQMIGWKRYLLVLFGAGVAMQLLLAAFILLYVNFPEGYNVPYGLSLDSITLFRTLWPYPVLSLPADTFRTLAIMVILALWGVYVVVWAWLDRYKLAARRKYILLVILAFALLYNMLLASIMPPVLSSDVYNYALYGRMMSFHGLNPYLTAGGALTGDPLFAFAGWHERMTVYGPTWTLISAGAAALAGQSVLFTALAFKGLAAFFNLANGLLVFLLARRLGGDGLIPLLLYAWNPLIMIETAGSGHNEATMVTFALLALLLLATRGSLLVSLAILLLSVLVKYFSGLLLLLVVARCVALEPTWRRRIAIAGIMGATGGILIAVLYLPFWPGTDRVRELVAGASPALNTMPNLVGLALRGAIANLLVEVNIAKNRGLADAYVLWGLNVAFGALVLLFVKTVATAKADWLRVQELWGVATLVYVVLIYAGMFPWYLVSPIAIACAGAWTPTNRRLLLWSSGLGLAMMLLYAMPIAIAR